MTLLDMSFIGVFLGTFMEIFRSAISKENLMDVPYFIKEHLWMSALREATLKPTHSNPRYNPPAKDPERRLTSQTIQGLQKPCNQPYQKKQKVLF